MIEKNFPEGRLADTSCKVSDVSLAPVWPVCESLSPCPLILITQEKGVVSKSVQNDLQAAE